MKVSNSLSPNQARRSEFGQNCLQSLYADEHILHYQGRSLMIFYIYKTVQNLVNHNM